MIWNGLHKDWIAAQEAKRAAAEAVAAADTSAAAVDAENRAAVAAREARDGVGFGEEEEGIEEEPGTEGGEVRHVTMGLAGGGGASVGGGGLFCGRRSGEGGLGTFRATLGEGDAQIQAGGGGGGT